MNHIHYVFVYIIQRVVGGGGLVGVFQVRSFLLRAPVDFAQLINIIYFGELHVDLLPSTLLFV